MNRFNISSRKSQKSVVNAPNKEAAITKFLIQNHNGYNKYIKLKQDPYKWYHFPERINTLKFININKKDIESLPSAEYFKLLLNCLPITNIRDIRKYILRGNNFYNDYGELKRNFNNSKEELVLEDIQAKVQPHTILNYTENF